MKLFFRTLLKKDKDIDWLAKEVGVTPQSVYSWKSGKSKPKSKYLQKIAKVLSLDIDHVIDDFYHSHHK